MKKNYNMPHLKVNNLNTLFNYLTQQLCPYRKHWNCVFFKDEISLKVYYNFGTRDGYLIHYNFPFYNGKCNEMIIWGRDYLGNRWDYKVNIEQIEYNKLKEKIYDLL